MSGELWGWLTVGESGLFPAFIEAAAIPVVQNVATRQDIAELKADIARDFQTLYPHLWLTGVGIVAAIVARSRLLA